MVAGLIGAMIGLGLSMVAGMANAQWKQLFAALCWASAAGASAVPSAACWATSSIPAVSRAIGWLVMGLGIGVVEGLYERSSSKIRNGLVGGAVGGILGGFLFDPSRDSSPRSPACRAARRPS